MNLKAEVTEGPSERTGSIIAPGGEPGQGLEGQGPCKAREGAWTLGR